ncbi:MAG: acyltransferase family protein [Sphingomonadales bacterium]
MEKNNAPNLGYSPSLDGLRAIAIILVLLSHANFRWGLNGGLGVSVFFALSGFLISTLLMEEFRKFGDVSFKGFYIRRTMRLFPALYVLLLFILGYAFFFRNMADQKLIYQDVTASALYVYNVAWYWGWCLKEMLLYHTWSLGVEEQFYLFWPLILYVCLKKKLLKQLQIGLLIFIAVSWALKAVNLFPYLAGSVIKEPIFLGCAVALIRWNRRSFRVPLGVAFLLFIAVITAGIIPYHFSNYELAFAVCGVFSAVIIIHVVMNPESHISSLLSNRMLVFIGKISYSLYLWHLPVFRIFAYHSTLPPMVSFVSKLVVSFLLAIISWYSVEKISTAYGRKVSKKITDKILPKTVAE